MFEEPDPAVPLLQRMCSAARAEACASAARLVAVGDMVSLRIAQNGGASDDWIIDANDAVVLEIAAALGVSRGWAASYVRYAYALRVQIPEVGRVFIAGDIDEATFRTAVFRVGLITDDDVRAAVDEQLAVRLPRWGTLSRKDLSGRIDKVIATVDADAVRRRRDRVADREVVVGDVGDGLAEVSATVFASDGHGFADRLTALAHTVCDADPRTLAQRRADAFGVIGAADRLGCRCGRSDCPATGSVASAVMIHVIAEQATVEGTGDAPGALFGSDWLIPAEVIAELAQTARLRPLIHPGDAPPERGYVPSRALADFVRSRDLTCRFPNCDVPATDCDVDHTIAHGEGGPTQASNLKCLCRTHHLGKTFWGWRDEQLRDGTVIWTSPAGERYVTHPGSALIFPGLCAPTAPVAAQVRTAEFVDKTAKMPRRTRTRRQSRAATIAAERRANHHYRTTPKTPPYVPDEFLSYLDTFPEDHDSIPPPF
ncbi:HNH endonuclease [Mycolicibacterium sp. P9-64]|uniref:HNH endonuclease signature motif containing protein n=1 Tax=Mycolicibacterium sp. P9-64 TaxID=2024612 RepID=UPI0011ED58AC|nr:HNH endonuclease signature motif containing protein [Mycolicibacterium sp. P9-64]KAA0086462.1 HNH endonuclease [Mycolicibacterium sp. P9-64]